MSNQHDPNEIENKLKQVKNAADKQHFNMQAVEDIKVNLRPDPTVKPAMFIPDPLLPGCYKAHPVTLRALRKDIFAAGNDLFEDLEDCDAKFR